MTLDYQRAIVTGGAGFIGSHLVGALLDEGLKVISIDNYLTGKRENLAPFRSNPHFREVECDLTDLEALGPFFEGVDIVFHQAASKKTVSMLDPKRDLDINIRGTFHVLELAREFGVRKFIHASTGSVYGEPVQFPQDESHLLNPASLYGVSKLAGEKYVSVFHHLYGLNATVLRYFHVYGPRQESSDYGGVVPIFIRRLYHNQPPIIFGDGTQQRSFTYVKDVVAANLLVAKRADETSGKVYNCASGIKVTIRELADRLCSLMGKEHIQPVYDEWVPGDIRVFDVSNARLRQLGFEFQTSFDEGLRKTVEWYREWFHHLG